MVSDGAGDRRANTKSETTIALRITGTVHIDLRRFKDESVLEAGAQRALQNAACAPPGADVVFRVARGQIPDLIGVGFLRERGGHLGSLRVECDDPATVRRWVVALREGMDQ